MKAIDLEEKYQIWWWHNLPWSLSGLKSGFFPSNPSLQVTGEMFLGEIWQFFAKKKRKVQTAFILQTLCPPKWRSHIASLSWARWYCLILTYTTMLLGQVISFHLVLTTGSRISWTRHLPYNAPL
jgi:hypothetical protein